MREPFAPWMMALESSFRPNVTAGYRRVFVGLGGLLLLASIMKSHQFATTPFPPDAGLSPAWLAVVVQAELALSSLLILNVLPRLLWWVSLSVFVSFAIVSVLKAVSGDATCGCFGSAEISPWWTFVLDIAAVGFLLRWRPGIGARANLHRIGPAFATCTAIGVPMIVAIVRFEPQTFGPGMRQLAGDSIVLLEPETWVAKKFPLTPYIQNGQQLEHGRWIVVLFHHQCSRCREILPRYERRSTIRNGAGERIALVELPPFKVTSPDATGSCWWSKLSPDYDWFVITPVEIHLFDGIVQRIDSSPEHYSSAEYQGRTTRYRGNVATADSRWPAERHRVRSCQALDCRRITSLSSRLRPCQQPHLWIGGAVFDSASRHPQNRGDDICGIEAGKQRMSI